MTFRIYLLSITAFLLPLIFAVQNTPAADLDILIPNSLIQSQFKSFSQEAGLALSYLPLSPAEPLGVLGFDIGVEVTAVNIREGESYWKAVAPDAPSQLLLPKVHVQKGLPFGFDVGAVFSKVPQSNVSMMGGELKWALLSGNAVLPAVAIRGSYTKLLGVDSLDLQTIGADLSISKGFAFITPYVGIGQVWVKSQEKINDLILNLKEERLALTKGFVGVKISLLVVNFVAEADFSKIPMYSGRINIGF
ncbi:MAG: hypothetical protein WAO55_05915 [Candidatus Manganitrophaceae bacterium]